ncbi:anti-sigma factor [Bacteroidia bacterium]|nr:anti-sigma factor [Bacteroidia bacterium]
MDKELLQRYVEGRASAGEIETVAAWLDADEKNICELNALHKLYDISLFNKPAFKQAARAGRRISFRKIALELAKVAAIFLVAWAGIRFFQENKPAEEEPPVAWQTLFVPAGQRAELTLADSTKVWLNAQSRLVYPTRFGQGMREVQLDGEAYFDVRHKGGQPFTVKTKVADIEVKGTEFNVAASSAARPTFAVSLLEGSIELKRSGQKQGYLVKPDEYVEWKEGKFHVSHIRDFEYFKWKEGLLCFTNETVGAIIEKLQLYYDVTIDVKKPGLLGHRYSGKFRTKDGVEQVLKVLQLEHRFAYSKDREHNLITIK